MKKSLRVLIITLLCISLLAACGGGRGTGPADKSVHVKTIEELVEAIKPDAEIVIEKGKYNMSEFLEAKYASSDFENWSKEHPYVQIRDAFDGCELVIKDLSGLKISGGGETADTELVVEPRYASVLYFVNCTDCEVSGLTMGHTETGSCSGNVVDFESCRKMYIKKCDLYGCGVYGVGGYSGSGDLNIEDTTIRDCEFGPFDFYSVFGDVKFTNCKLTGSNGAGSFWDEYHNAKLIFTNCEFGGWESYLQFDEEGNMFFENCTFSEDYPYYEGDFGEGERYIPTFEPEKFEKAEFTTDFLEFTRWDGYSMTEKKTQKTEMLDGSQPVSDSTLPYINIYFRPDGKLAYSAAEAEYDYEYEVNQDGTVTIKSGDIKYTGTYYKNYIEEDWWASWMLLDMGDWTVWFY